MSAEPAVAPDCKHLWGRTWTFAYPVTYCGREYAPGTEFSEFAMAALMGSRKKDLPPPKRWICYECGKEASDE